MFYLRKILKDNNLSIAFLAEKIGINRKYLEFKLLTKVDFTIEDLEKIKNILVDMHIIQPNFDIGEFLNIVWGDYVWQV